MSIRPTVYEEGVYIKHKSQRTRALFGFFICLRLSIIFPLFIDNARFIAGILVLLILLVSKLMTAANASAAGRTLSLTPPAPWRYQSEFCWTF